MNRLVSESGELLVSRVGNGSGGLAAELEGRDLKLFRSTNI